MKTRSLKAILIISTVFVALSLGIQFYILNHIYNNERKQFDTQIAKSVNSLFEDRLLFGDHKNLVGNFIQSNTSGYFIPFDSIPNQEETIDELARDLSDFGLICSFHFYVCKQNDSRYSKMFAVEMDNNGFKKEELHSVNLVPPIHGQHIYIDFPDKKDFLLKKLNPWLLSYLMLIICLTIVAFSLYHFFKHRFWNGVQKEFINNLMHEFRTPLSVISIGSKVLQSNGIENDSRRLKKYTKIIKDQTDQLQNKVSQMLELSLSGKKSTYVHRESVDVNTLIANAIDWVEPLIQEKKAVIEFIPCTNPRRLNADETYLTRALVNLLDNSLKYANIPYIRLETSHSEKNCSISIRDNGIGMEKKYFKHIFRKYYRIPTGNVHNVKGFGIGLNFVKNVVNAHNGRIEVSSIPGKGTEFRIKLPLT